MLGNKNSEIVGGELNRVELINLVEGEMGRPGGNVTKNHVINLVCSFVTTSSFTMRFFIRLR